jgi:hypothetical protein
MTSTDTLTVDFVARQFTYTDANGTERRAKFPDKGEPRLDDLARTLASVRGWGDVGGQNEWLRLSFDEFMTDDDIHGVLVPNSFALELTGHNAHADLDNYVTIRGSDPTLWSYGRIKGKAEESLSNVSVGLVGLRYLYDSVQDGIKDGAVKGYVADSDVFLMRVIYKRLGENEFEVRSPCRFDAPEEWRPSWD